MALPIAQLGYMPNLGSPGRGPTTVIDDPWRQLAAQALSAALQKGIANSFEQDYTSQAQKEGLPIDSTAKASAWYAKPFTGARTNEDQLNRLRTEQAGLVTAKGAQTGENKRQAEQLAATHKEGEATRGFQREEGIRRSIDETNRLMAELTNRAAIAAGGDATQLAGIDKQLAGAQAREGIQGQTSRDVAHINADAVSKQAALIDSFNKLQGGARQNAILQQAGIPVGAGISLEQQQALLDYIARMQAMSGKVAPAQ